VSNSREPTVSILLFVNLKGGVAKTTSAVAVAECLADEGHRTLVIDADHQCMASELLLGQDRALKLDNKKKTLHDLLLSMLDEKFSADKIPSFVVGKASDIGAGMPNLSAIPCSIRIDEFQSDMARARLAYPSTDDFLSMFRLQRDKLRRWLERNYDFTIIDCPPSVASQVKVFLSVGDWMIVPAIPDQLSVRGTIRMLDRIRRFRCKITGLGTLWSLYRQEVELHRRTVEAAKKKVEPWTYQLPEPFPLIIPNAAAIARASEPGQDPRSFSAKYTSPFAKLYRSLCEEIVRRSQWQAPQGDGAVTTASAGKPPRQPTGR
jgi:chromosome partitioning protein